MLLRAGDEVGVTGEIAEINRLKAEREILNEEGGLRRFTARESAAAGFVRLSRSGNNPIILAINPTDDAAPIDLDAALAETPPGAADLP